MRPSTGKILKSVRWTTIVLGLANLVKIVLATILLCVGHQHCRRPILVPVMMVLIVAILRIVSMARSGIVQYGTAIAMLGDCLDGVDGETKASRSHRKMQYTKWAFWTRISSIIVVLQFIFAVWVIYVIDKAISQDEESHHHCVLGSIGRHEAWKQHVLVSFGVMVTFVAMLQCLASSDVLRWSTFYSTNDNVWKAHYHEVFDHSMREALCCLGRRKYMCSMEEDEVYSVAKLLGDLVTYRASGTGHMELLTGLTLLQTKNQLPEVEEGFVDAPEEILQEAITYHPFAEAAYTGPLLDVGRTLLLFPCVWLYRQGIFNAVWSRNSRPELEGDNWWRGHAAAFLSYANVSPVDLRKGRVNQAECQAVYFIVVHHGLKSVIITVRGTETPEDLITDGLCKECPLTNQDLDGLINSNIDYNVRQRVISSFPHYGHSGIIEAARELFKQIDGCSSEEGGDIESQPRGFLSSLLEVGCECEGYNVRLVGHSLGGSIASVLAIMLYGRYPNLHVFSFGPLPCVDLVIAEACSCFITGIIHDGEFSACLSANSILRLRATTLTSVAQDKSTDESVTNELASLFIDVSKFDGEKMGQLGSSRIVDVPITSCQVDDHNSPQHCDDVEGNSKLEQGSFLKESHTSETNDASRSIDSSRDDLASNKSTTVDVVAQFMEQVPPSDGVTNGNPSEMFLAGQVIHLLRQQRSVKTPLWKGRRVQERAPKYRAIIANRENFKDITVSVYMFLDHLPWRSYQAMKEVLECRNRGAL